MSKTVSARIPVNLHDELRDRCNQLGCTINEFIAASVELGMTGHSEFEFGFEDVEDSRETIESSTMTECPKPQPATNFRVIKLGIG